MGGASMFGRLFSRLTPVVLCAVLGALFAVPAGAAGNGNGNGNGAGGSAAGGGGANPSVNLDQCRNGSATSPNDCEELGGGTGWVDGNAGASQAHYIEGYSAPYRLVMEDLPTATPITVVLGYDVKHNGAHAIDFLTHYDRLEPHTGFGHEAEDVDPSSGVTGISATVGTFPIPAPSSVGSPVAGQPTAAFNGLPSAEREMTLFGGTIAAMAYVSEGDLNDSQSETQVSVTFTVDGPTAVLAWGGHIAREADWGTGESASGISGSPYHMRLDSWTLGNLGNTDRSLSAGAVFGTEPEAPAQLTVTKIVVNDDGGTALVGDFDLFVDGTQVTSGAANTLSGGTYTVSEADAAGYVGTIGGDCALDGTITVDAGETAACTITNDDVAATLTVTKIVVNDDGGTALVGDFDLFVDDTQVTSGAANTLDAGTYTVSEADEAGYVGTIGGDCAPDGTITLALAETAQCTITNDDVDVAPARGRIIVEKRTLPIGSSPAFDFTADYDSDGFSLTNGQSNDSGPLAPGPYSVAETATAGWDLTSAICSDGSDPDSIDLNAGETVTCVFTNSLIVEPNDDPPTNTTNQPPATDTSGTSTTNNPPATNPTPGPVDPETNSVRFETQPSLPPEQPATLALSPAGELPRTGAGGLRAETLLALALLFAGLTARALGRRQRPTEA